MDENKTKKLFSKKYIFILISLIIIIGVIIFLSLYNTDVNRFKRNLEDYNISELKEIYKSTVSYDEKKKIENIFVDKLNEILEEFATNKKSYEEVYEEIEKYSEFSNLENKTTTAKNQLEEIKTSKDYFFKGQNAEKNNSIFEAITNYLQVIELDKENYEIAKKYINNNKNNLKNSTLLEVDQLINSEDYINANLKLELLNKIFVDDKEINNKISTIKDKAKKQEVEKLKTEQEVVVLSATKHKEWYSDTLSGIRVIVQNNTEKVVKSYIVSVLAYDSSNYPLKIEYNDYEKIFKSDGANIQSGATHGKDNYCDIYYEVEKISSALACVKEVEYYDGSTWENPYYEYWLEEYKEKPLQ